MNKYFLIIITIWSIISSNNIFAQNLVLNPSFENTTGSCSGFAAGESFNQVTDWDNANSNTPGDSCSSPDLFSPCNTMPLVGGPGPMFAPDNLLGSQCAKTGDRYAGIITNEMGTLGQSYREYIQGKLSSPLQAGQTYCVSFYVSLADAVNYATNNIGVYFSNTQYMRDACAQGPLINETPQLNYDCNLILETTDWVLLSWDYVATGGESYFMIGNFYNDANTQIVGTGVSSLNPYAYYYIDDVSVQLGACDFAEIMMPNTNSCDDVGSNPSDPFATFCTSDPAINLVAQQGSNCTNPPSPGTWAGTGITDVTNGTFNPSTAGTGTHTITYTTQGGYVATVKVLVSDCAAIAVCKEANGDLTASGGTAPFSWQNEVITQDCSACMFGCTIPAGCAVNVTSWANFATGATIPAPTTYPIRVKDAAGVFFNIANAAAIPACNTTACPPITIAISNQSDVKCKGGNDGSATVSASGGATPYTYKWNPGNLTGATQSNLTAGSYTVTTTDNNNCPGTATVTIIEPDAALAASSSKTDICGSNNGTASATATGGTVAYTYSWSNGATTQNITNLTAGNYTVTVTDKNNCTATSQVTIAASSNTVPQFTNPGPICAGTTFTLPNTSNNGVIGTWSPAINNTQTTTYTFVPNTNQCAIDTTFDVVVNVVPSAPSTTSTAATCTQQGASTMNGYDANNTYTFTPTGPTIGAGGAINGMVTGTNYTVTVTSSGCASPASNSFSNSGPLSAATTPTVTVTPASCTANGTSTMNNYSASNTYTFTPAGPTIGTSGIINNMTIGQSYTVTISNGSCSSSPSAPFSNAAQLSTPATPVVSTTDPNCVASGIATIDNFDATVTYTFSPTGPTSTNGTIVGMNPGQNYTVTAGSSGCSSPQSTAFTISPQFAPPTVNAGLDTSICQGNSVTLTASGALTYEWDNNLGDGVSKTVSPTNTTTYTVTGTDINGCTNTDQVTVAVLSNSGIDISVDTTNGCAPLTVNFSNQTTGATNYIWDFGDGTTSTATNPTHTYTQDTCFTVTFTADNGQGCAVTLTMADPICVYPNPIASFTASTYEITNYNTDVKFYNSSQDATAYNWYFGDLSPVNNEISPKHTYSQDEIMNYNVVLIAKNSYGCADTARAIIKMKEEIIFFVPNTFTPDGDQFNNTFTPVFAEGFDAFDYEMLIFDRWGEVIFETHDTKIGWDGTYKGKICQDGTYVWKILVKKRDTVEKYDKTGHVLLLK